MLAEAPPLVTMAMGAAVAIMQTIMQAFGQVFRLSSKARDHGAFAAGFAALERQLARLDGPTDADLRELRGALLLIEAREPPIKRYLDLICHNQVARTIGSDDIEPLTWWQAKLAQSLNGDRALQ